MNPQKRNLLFTACILARLGLALVAKFVPNDYLPYLGYLALVPVIGFVYQYNYSKQTGFFGQKLWWNPFRLFHALMYFLFAILAILKNESAYLVLLADAFAGVCIYIRHHYLATN